MTIVHDASLRERKKAKTRQALEDAALELFARQGFERTTVEQIADACDVSPRTFFRYYATKEDVLFGDAPQKFEQMVAALAARPADEPALQSLRAAALALAAGHEGQRKLLRARAKIINATPSLRAHGSERQDNWNDAAVQLLARRRGLNAKNPPLELRLVVAASSAAMRAARLAWIDGSGPELVPLVNEAFDRLAAGLDT